MSRSTQEAPPTGWTSYPFWAIATEKVISGRESEGLLSVYLDRGVIPYSEGGGLVHKPADSLEKYQLVEPGDFVMNNQQAWRGSVGVSKHRGIVSPAYLVFSLDKSRLLPEFAAYMFRDKSYVEKYMLSSLSVGDIQRQVKWNHLRKIAIHLPSKEGQQALVKYLDRETSRIDSLIEKKTRFIDLLKEKRQAVITKAVTKGIDPSVPMRDSGVKWLGNVPAHWHVSPLKHYLDRNDGGVWGDEPTSETDTIVLRSTEQAVDGSWQIIDPARRKLSSSEISKSLLREGDLLVTKSSGSEQHIGKTSLVTEDVAKLKACYSNFMQRLRVSHKTTPEFVALILNNRIAREQLAYQSNSTTGLANLTAGMIGEVKCCFPPLHEQNELIKNIHANTTPLDLLSDKTNRSIELLKEHRSALITAAITGKIDVRISK